MIFFKIIIAKRWFELKLTITLTWLWDSWNYMPPILVRSSAKHIATQVSVIAKWKKRFFWEAFCLWYYPPLQGTKGSKLATETQEKNKVWKLFKIKNEDTRTMSVAFVICQWQMSERFTAMLVTTVIVWFKIASKYMYIYTIRINWSIQNRIIGYEQHCSHLISSFFEILANKAFKNKEWLATKLSVW